MASYENGLMLFLELSLIILGISRPQFKVGVRLHSKRSVGVSMAEWLVFVLESLSTHHCGFESCNGLWNFFHVRKQSLQLVYLTFVVLLMCPLVPEIMQGGAPEAFLYMLNLENHHMTLTVSVRLET